MENVDPSLLQRYLEGTNNDSDNAMPAMNLLPDAFLDSLMAVFMALTVISALFLLVYVVSTIRKWKVQSAVMNMQKDVAAIKKQLGAKDAENTSPSNDEAR